MASWRFKRQLRYRPWRHTSRTAEQMAETDRRPWSRIAHEPVDQRPMRFAVGLEQFGAGVMREELCASPPLDPAVYLGRVEEIEASGAVIATVWEYPSGRESVAVLPADALSQPNTHPGASLRIFTWMEWPRESAAPGPRVHVEVRNKQLSAQDMADIRQLLDELQSPGEGQ